MRLVFLWTVCIVGMCCTVVAQQTAPSPDPATTHGKAEAAAPGIGTSAQTPEATAESQASQRLQEARQALRGKEKNLPLAERVLSGLVNQGALDLPSADRCCLYVYLGYVEDLRGNRQAAIRWFEKGAALDGLGFEGIRAIAKTGLSQPIVWLRHLDSQILAQDSVQSSGRTPARPTTGVLTYEMPTPLPGLKKHLSEAERLENFNILCETIDKKYSFFEHKRIDWKQVEARYRPRIAAASSTDDFYRVFYDLMRELKDAHSHLCNYRPDVPRFCPSVCTAQVEEKAVVTHVVDGSQAHAKGLRPGAVITRIDGQSVTQKIEQLRKVMPASSSERHFVAAAHERLLHGEKDSTTNLTFLAPGSNVAVEAVLQRTAYVPSPRMATGFPLEKGQFLWSGMHPSGYGYIRIVSFVGRAELADEFDRALEKLKDSPGLLIDIRDNPGGSGMAQLRIIGRLISVAAEVGKTFHKNGPGHQDFASRESSISPAGDWQYTKPVALLTNIHTGSASDLFTCRMRGTGRAITVGTTTHGNLSGVSVYVTLPCGLVARVSTGYIVDTGGRNIEVDGNMPQIHAERTVKDVVNGTDSVLDRAVQALQEAKAGKTPWRIPGESRTPRESRGTPSMGHKWARELCLSGRWR